jgi:serine/threonine protein kinase
LRLKQSHPVLFRIVEDDNPPLPEGLSDNLRAFLTSCFRKDPTKRPTAEQLFETDWVKWGLGLEDVSPAKLPSFADDVLIMALVCRSTAERIAYPSFAE